jgi:hypothetical protein
MKPLFRFLVYFYKNFWEGFSPASFIDESPLMSYKRFRGYCSLNKSYGQQNSVLVVFTTSERMFRCDGNRLLSKCYL